MKSFQEKLQELVPSLLINLFDCFGLGRVHLLLLLKPGVENVVNRVCQDFNQTLSQKVGLAIEESQ